MHYRSIKHFCNYSFGSCYNKPQQGTEFDEMYERFSLPCNKILDNQDPQK